MKNKKSYHFFWSGSPYSSWYPCEFTVELVLGDFKEKFTYSSLNQYFEHTKAIVFEDWGLAKKIMASDNPRRQRKLTKRIGIFSANFWVEHREEILKRGLLSKFQQNPELRKLLVREKCDLFVLADPKDRVWGVGMKAEEAALTTEKDWIGRNLFGKALTEVRDELLNYYR